MDELGECFKFFDMKDYGYKRERKKENLISVLLDFQKEGSRTSEIEDKMLNKKFEDLDDRLKYILKNWWWRTRDYLGETEIKGKKYAFCCDKCCRIITFIRMSSQEYKPYKANAFCKYCGGGSRPATALNLDC